MNAQTHRPRIRSALTAAAVSLTLGAGTMLAASPASAYLGRTVYKSYVVGPTPTLCQPGYTLSYNSTNHVWYCWGWFNPGEGGG